MQRRALLSSCDSCWTSPGAEYNPTSTMKCSDETHVHDLYTFVELHTITKLAQTSIDFS
jgi:hypothetical protein